MILCIQKGYIWSNEIDEIGRRDGIRGSEKEDRDDEVIGAGWRIRAWGNGSSGVVK